MTVTSHRSPNTVSLGLHKRYLLITFNVWSHVKVSKSFGPVYTDMHTTDDNGDHDDAIHIIQCDMRLCSQRHVTRRESVVPLMDH